MPYHATKTADNRIRFVKGVHLVANIGGRGRWSLQVRLWSIKTRLIPNSLLYSSHKAELHLRKSSDRLATRAHKEREARTPTNLQLTAAPSTALLMRSRSGNDKDILLMTCVWSTGSSFVYSSQHCARKMPRAEFLDLAQFVHITSTTYL